jgi:endonuclease/exonuclease/phosphatase family metal-dependent hydrolase
MKKLLKICLIILTPFVLLILWLTVTDYKPKDIEPAVITHTAKLKAEETLEIFNWNLGYGGLGREMDFFMDEGERIRAPKDEYLSYRDGIYETIRNSSAEIYFFQEIDRKSTRSYKDNQLEQISEILTGKSYSFAPNYRVKYIPSPRIIGTQYGSVHSGLAIYSDYLIEKAERRSLPGNYAWPKKIFFLDRCLLMTVLPEKSGREWVLINLHTSAYDKGGFLKKEQLEFIKELATNEFEQGRYVVIGGDWNSYMPGTDDKQFPSTEVAQKFYQPLPEDWSMPGWSWAFDPETATNRSLKEPFEEGKSFKCVIDGFLVSPNVDILEVEGIELNFTNSDHNPVRVRVGMK